MKIITFFVFFLIFLDYSFASFSFNNCGADTDPVVFESYDFPDNFLQINQPITFSFNYSVIPGASIPEGSSATVTIWYQDFAGEPWMKVPVDICSVSNQINCPVSPGEYIFQEINLDVPELPLGQWKVQILLSNSTNRLACNEIYFTTNNGTSPYPSNCEYTSSYKFTATIQQSDVHFQTPDVSSRHKDDWLQIGSLGFWGSWNNISFLTMSSSPDNSFGNYLNSSQFLWAVNATISQILTDSTYYAYEYSGNFWIGSTELDMNSWTKCFIKGDTVFTVKYLKTNLQLSSLTGEVDVIPITSFPNGWNGPVSFGRLNPATISLDPTSRTLTIEKSEVLCQCEVDPCGVCGGDGSTCQTSKSESKAGVIVASVVVPVVVVSAIIIFLVIYQKRRSKRKLRDDIMNPNIPSYNSSDWTRIGDIN